jgi:hypothetical protein
MSQVNTELQNPLTSVIRLNDSQVRALAGKPSGTIRMSDLYGKSYWKYADLYVNGRWFDADQHYLFVYVGGGMPGNYFEIRLIYTSTGLPLGTIGSDSTGYTPSPYLDSYGTNGGNSGSSGDVYTIALNDPYWPRWSTQPGNYVLNTFQIWQKDQNGTLVAGSTFDVYRDPGTDPADVA